MRHVKSLRQLAQHHTWTPESELPEETVYNEFRSPAEEAAVAMLPGDGEPEEHAFAEFADQGGIQRRLEHAREVHARADYSIKTGETPVLEGPHGKEGEYYRDTSQDGVTRDYDPDFWGDSAIFDVPKEADNLSEEDAPSVRGFKIVQME